MLKAVLACVSIIVPATAVLAEESFDIDGAVSRPGVWTAARLEDEMAGEWRSITVPLKGESRSWKCVPLLALLRRAEPKFDSATKHAELAFAVVVRGHDGYTVCFSWAELELAEERSPIWLAVEVDGQPLVENEAPARLIVPGAPHPNRWIFGIESITVVDGRAAVANSSP